MGKKLLSLLLAVCMVLTLLPTAVFASDGPVTLLVNSAAANDDAARADQATYKTLDGAIAKAVSGDTVKLVTDIALGTTGVTIDKSVTLDLNGQTITFGQSGGAAITLSGNASLTVQGGTLTATAGSSIIHNSTGTLTIASGTVTSADSTPAIYNNGTGPITISGGNVKRIDKGQGALKNGAIFPAPVYLAVFTEPSDNPGKVFTIQLVNQDFYTYDLSQSTHIDNKWYVWLPEGPVLASYGVGEDEKHYVTTVQTDGSAEFAPSYGVSFDIPNDILNLDGATVGYGDQTPKRVTISNPKVKQPTGPLAVTLSGDNANCFTLSETTVGNLDPGQSETFTVTPNTGLAVGTYTATVTLTNADNGINKSFAVNFTVSAVAPSTYAVTLSGGGTGASGAGDYAPGATVDIQAGSNSGYTFRGWTSGDGVTFADAASAATSFTMPAKAVTVTANWTASSGGGSTPSTPGASATVDGKIVDLGTTETKGDTTTAILDQTKLDQVVERAQSGGTVTIPITTTKDSAAVRLAAKSMEKMAGKDMTLEVKTGKIAYTLPAAALDTKALLDQLGATDASQVAITVTITDKKTVQVTGAKQVGSAMGFNVSASLGGKTAEVERFGAMVQRTVALTKEQAGAVSSAVVVEPDGTLRHVPTHFYANGGTWYAKISSMTNSTYALVAVESAFTDVSGKWYEAAAQELSARAITSGVFDTQFQGDKAITRAEFAALLVSGLGLPRDGKADFMDVPADAWYSGFVATASGYGIVNGVGGGRFAPDATITRQEAMVMIQRAATVVGYAGGGTSIDALTDRGEVSAWAAEGVAFNLANGLIVGHEGKISPKATITRAETATVVLRLLQQAQLIDVRTEV